MANIIQITKIQLRRGRERDLPGAPSNLSPLFFTPGLGEGEIAFATDSGRVFVGHSPNTGNPNFRRATFPYQNIEVLTENSVDTIMHLLETALRSREAGYFPPVILNPTNSFDENNWATVLITTDAGNMPFRIDHPGGAGIGAAEITYFIFKDSSPIRQGRMMIISSGSVAEPLLTDNSTMAPIVDNNADAAGALGFIRFRAAIAGPPSDPYLALQYRNTNDAPLRMIFRIERPRL
jgi:hypothetical protein